jgi:hypothetical protein
LSATADWLWRRFSHHRPTTISGMTTVSVSSAQARVDLLDEVDDGSSSRR